MRIRHTAGCATAFAGFAPAKLPPHRSTSPSRSAATAGKGTAVDSRRQLKLWRSQRASAAYTSGSSATAFRPVASPNPIREHAGKPRQMGIPSTHDSHKIYYGIYRYGADGRDVRQKLMRG